MFHLRIRTSTPEDLGEAVSALLRKKDPGRKMTPRRRLWGAMTVRAIAVLGKQQFCHGDVHHHAALEDLDDHGYLRAVRSRILTQSHGEDAGDGRAPAGGYAAVSNRSSAVKWSRELWSQLEPNGEYEADVSD